MVGETRKPSRPYWMARSNSFLNGSFPNLAWRSTHACTQPGTVTESQPRIGIDLYLLKYSSVQPGGDRPGTWRPSRRFAPPTTANGSEPMPFDTGSTSES